MTLARIISIRLQDRLIVRILEIFLIFLVTVATNFSFSGYMINEVDVLPDARQFFEHNWLPNDWYLNLDIEYRYLFNSIFGPIISWLGFKYGALFTRSLIYFFLAFALHCFFRTIHLRFSLMLLVVYFFLKHQSLVADEWIIGGAETKSIAYAFVLLSFSAFFLKHYGYGFALAGMAMSFHVLIGLYPIFCTAGALLANWKTYSSEWQTIASRSWVFFVTGIFGLRTIIAHLMPHVSIDVIRASDIYVNYRLPHHLLPAAWGQDLWVLVLALATCFFLTIYFIGRSRIYKFIAAYALGSVLLFVLGISIYKLGHTHLLKYYWFRFPDVMVPFMSCVLTGLILNAFANGYLPLRYLPHIPWHRMLPVLSRGLSVVLIIFAAGVIFRSTWQLQEKLLNSIRAGERDSGENAPMLEWIKENTPKDAVFLIDPTMSDFYIYPQRAVFVTFKHLPQSEADILEWYERIKLCNGNRDPEKKGFKSINELKSHFYNLDENIIKRISDLYDIDYYLGLSERPLTFKREHSINGYTLYKIRR